MSELPLSVRLYQRDAGQCQRSAECMKIIREYIDTYGQTATKPITVYRGQTVEATIDPGRRGFFSASADEDIAADFAGRDGHLFTIHLQPGVKYIRIPKEANTSGYSYEEEYLVKSGGRFEEGPDRSLKYFPRAGTDGKAKAFSDSVAIAAPSAKKRISRRQLINERIAPSYKELDIPFNESELTNAEIRTYLGAHEELEMSGGKRRTRMRKTRRHRRHRRHGRSRKN